MRWSWRATNPRTVIRWWNTRPSAVEVTLSSLKDAGLVRFVYPSHGRSVTRYRQVIDERLAMDQEQLAILAVLLLRGPQTVAELRARSERMASFDGASARRGRAAAA